ncbi:MAG: Ig-like domain-containing protein [Acidobacteriota bacterium]|nr:Ig-like domain-containing protein [Acidobacteriota bacterium]
MWRWVTRGLVLTFVALLAPLLFAQTQTFIGDVDAPDPSRPQSGLIIVKGWAIDQQQISRIELWVDNQYQHNAVLYLPRIDVVEAYPDWPGIHGARPGFITGFSANRFPNGQHTVELRVYNSNGDVHIIGTRQITINNSINQAPFGFLDIPGAGPITNVSGAFPVSGWAADLDGIERIEVLIDDGILQGAMYGDPRPDVGVTFPDFTGALFSGYVANIDSTRIQNGVHLLTVRAVDRQGITTMIGRRQVQIINNDQFLKPFGYLEEPQRDAVLYGTGCGPNADPGPVSPPITPGHHLTTVRGWALDLGTRRDTGRVAYAELMVDGVRWLSTDDCGVVAGRFANCYGLPRFDVARYYPTFPDAPRAGYLFTLDVGALMNLGVHPGNHRLSVRVGDREQTFAELPNKDGLPVWFQCVDQSTFDFVGFGFIEFPNVMDYVTGTVVFRGWALDENGTITSLEVYVDGNFLGTAQYGFPRNDVADQYPHVVNSANSGWAFSFDTRKLTNARHRLTVRAIDSRGHAAEIGSVDFYTTNNTTP